MTPPTNFGVVVVEKGESETTPPPPFPALMTAVIFLPSSSSPNEKSKEVGKEGKEEWEGRGKKKAGTVVKCVCLSIRARKRRRRRKSEMGKEEVKNQDRRGDEGALSRRCFTTHTGDVFPYSLSVPRCIGRGFRRVMFVAR